LVPDKLQGKRDARGPAPSLSALAALQYQPINSGAARACIKRPPRIQPRKRVGVATIAVLTGAYLGHRAHAGSFGKTEQVVAVGAICALMAVGVQAATAALLGTTTLCMGAARYI
jgi:hypothetical protein